jgi:hypothetical protein
MRRTSVALAPTSIATLLRPYGLKLANPGIQRVLNGPQDAVTKEAAEQRHVEPGMLRPRRGSRLREALERGGLYQRGVETEPTGDRYCEVQLAAATWIRPV